MKIPEYCSLLLLLISALQLSAQEDPIAAGQDKWLGNVYSSAQLPEFENYWNQVTPENAGKWGSVENTRDVYNWNALDAAYDLAKSNGFPFRYHVLIWGNQQPSWIENLATEEQLLEIQEWMDTVAARYPDIDYLEVVNEPINDPPRGSGNGNYIGALGGTGDTGYDWIINAFQMARDRFPNAQLVINEYNIVSSSSRASEYRGIIELLIDRGLIDAIGVQAHAFSTRGSVSAMTGILDDLAETGLPIMATEMDVDGPTDIQQVEDYRRIFPVLWGHPSVIGVTLWGWRPGMWRTDEQAYLIKSNNVERPALEWLRNYVEAGGVEVPAQSVSISTVTGTFEIQEKGGTLQLLAEVTPENATLSGTFLDCRCTGGCNRR